VSEVVPHRPDVHSSMLSRRVSSPAGIFWPQATDQHRINTVGNVLLEPATS
jgi:hypothetical protein